MIKDILNKMTVGFILAIILAAIAVFAFLIFMFLYFSFPWSLFALLIPPLLYLLGSLEDRYLS